MGKMTAGAAGGVGRLQKAGIPVGKKNGGAVVKKPTKGKGC